MRITQAYISPSLYHFKKAFFEKFGLYEGKLKVAPTVVFGMYRVMDYQFCMHHKAPIVIVWCGRDSGGINNMRLQMLKHMKDVRHIATSQRIGNDLAMHGLEYELLPVSPAKITLKSMPRGDNLYCYYGYNSERGKQFYGYYKAQEVEKRTGIKVYFATGTTYTHQKLISIYLDCFMGLRLTPRDGVSVTVAELGVLGRRSIFNGDSPSAVPWIDVDDICESVVKEYDNRKSEDWREVSRETRKYLDISDNWLCV